MHSDVCRVFFGGLFSCLPQRSNSGLKCKLPFRAWCSLEGHTFLTGLFKNVRPLSGYQGLKG